MQYSLLSALLAAGLASACTPPTGTPSTTITKPFGILIQNPAYPAVHNHYMNLDPAGGGDKHLFLNPVGDSAFNLDLMAGVLEQGIIHAVIGGEYSAVDNTTKMFMTERGDPKAIFKPVYGCNPDNDAVQTQLSFVTWQQHTAGGHICVRIASGNRGYEFRYSPPGNTAVDSTNPCIAVTMVVVAGAATTTPATSTTKPATSTSKATSTTRATTTTPSSTATALPYTDMTAKGWSFVGCAPEERNAADGPGRTLSLASTASDTMTETQCLNFCAAGGYSYFGTEYARECYCGNTVAPGRVPKTTKASLAGCNFNCSGLSSSICGGDAWLSLYKKCAAGAACKNAKFT